jgi:hAT family C-terminal dimerisation region
MFHSFSHCFILLTFPSHKINAQRYGPVWSSIARDYLSIMASSVSSERAFSQGGITISKRRNRLKGDIVEALQCVKCAIRHDLLFREPGPSSLVEDELDAFEIEEESGEKSEVEDEGWDGIFLEDTPCDDSESDTDIDLL